ncbi:hypothetical protein [Campylobacter showae]|uniref:Uncharacterized protein n=1 Tax=Campylobacter showae CSUNSWCD TaxID=1244083 RepID=M5II39_9BACT|nr:hypothetical protein [Campylobacter showae]EKU12227.1 hypothetical protein CSUNSWCD_167 [Campylobacter showae CSUNSWCD]
MNKRDFNQALRYLAKGADAPSYTQLKDFAFRLWTSLHKRGIELERARGDKAREAFQAEVAKREAKGIADALFETGLQAYRLFNYYASECEKLEEQIKLLSELNDKL